MNGWDLERANRWSVRGRIRWQDVVALLPRIGWRTR